MQTTVEIDGKEDLGMTEAEISTMENRSGKTFPAAYKEFLFLGGKGANMIADLNHQVLSYQDGEEYWKERQESGPENMKEEDVTVEKDIWVFADLGPEQFDFFYLDEGDDSKVYYYCAYLDGEDENEYAGFCRTHGTKNYRIFA
ncbi:MAG: SMI1/KNR4 family protein [Chitinophagaceae bacterium]|nr:SMI1/KNR4 family protein [Chitinophagaceae bacterium]